MQIEIWSDVVCPFCYIGKRKFEQALNEFAHAAEVKITWKSFQLNPNTVTDPESNIHEYLATHKGISLTEATRMNDYVTAMAREVGLEYDFDKAVVANTFNAHRVIHFAKKYDLQGEAKERMLRAYFTEGKNIDDIPTLVELGSEIGLPAAELSQMLHSDALKDEVKYDMSEAQQLRIHSVPFFVFNRKYGVSGAQPVEVFLNTLEKTYQEFSTVS